MSSILRSKSIRAARTTCALCLLFGLVAFTSACDDDTPTVYIKNGKLVNLPPGGRVFTQSIFVGDSLFEDGFISNENDADGYTFTLGEDARVDISAIGTGVLDAFLELYDTNGDFLFDDDNSGVGDNALITAELSAGTYHALVWSSTTGPFSGSYDFEVFVEASVDGGAGSFDEGRMISVPPGGETLPNDLVPFADAYTVENSIFDEFDADGYPFTVAVDTQVIISMESLDQLNPFLEIYNEDGIFVLDDEDGGIGTDSLIVADLEAGDYTLVAWSSQTGPVSGDYKITVQSAVFGGVDFQTIAINESVTEIDQDLMAGDFALTYVFSLDDPAHVSFDAIQQVGGNADIAIQLVDQRGNEVFFLDPPALDSPSLVDVSLSRGTYILVVSNDSAAAEGTFDLTIDVGP